MTELQKAKRMAYAVRNINLDWTRVVFTDSKIFTWKFSNRPRTKKAWVNKDS